MQQWPEASIRKLLSLCVTLSFPLDSEKSKRIQKHKHTAGIAASTKTCVLSNRVIHPNHPTAYKDSLLLEDLLGFLITQEREREVAKN